MSPKPVKRLISLLNCGLGLAGHYQWEKEILIDYVSSKFTLIEEDISEDAKFDGVSHESHYHELCKIAKALRKHAGAGLHAKIELTGVFYDLRDFVEWDKEELADYLVHQIVALDLPAVFENNQGNKRMADEISTIAFAIYAEQSFDGCSDAEKDAREMKKYRNLRRAHEIAQREADEEARQAKEVGAASVPFTTPVAAPAPSPVKSAKKTKAA
jgi:hypothetical protein